MISSVSNFDPQASGEEYANKTATTHTPMNCKEGKPVSMTLCCAFIHGAAPTRLLSSSLNDTPVLLFGAGLCGGGIVGGGGGVETVIQS